MKRMRLITAVTLIISFLLSATSVSGVTMGQLVADAEELFKSPISQELKEKLETLDENDMVPVAIELKDTADLEKANTEAIQQANISVSEVDIMSMDTEALTDEENRIHQAAVLEITDRIRMKKTEILKAHYTQYNAAFIQEWKIPENRIGFVSRLLPYIGYVLLTPAEIVEISRDHRVENISYVEPELESVSSPVESLAAGDTATLDEAIEIIGGDLAIEQGYTGSGIRVGVISDGRPDLSILASYANSIQLTERAENDMLDIYSTIICEVIKRMAPECNIYVSSVGQAYEALFEIDTLIADYGVQIINISAVEYGIGYATRYSRNIDTYVRNYDVSITVAAGDNWSDGVYVNQLAMGNDVIAVGAVVTQGTDNEADGAFSLWNYNAFREYSVCANRPDICAPGVIAMYNETFSSTKVATAFVTGTITQMLSRLIWLEDKPETIKAALIASGYHNAGTDRSYVQGTLSSNQEGAGIIDAEFCYWVARNSRREHFDTQNGQYLYTRDVWVDTVSQPFRIACTWRITDSTMINPDNFSDYDFDLVIYKDGVRVAGSGSWASHDTYAVLNYEVIELSPEVLQTYGAGTYHVEIWLLNYGDTIATPGFRIGLAWEQPNI